ncbi:MAG: hypothetical protein QM676_05385 [Novosphingobium sp.]
MAAGGPSDRFAAWPRPAALAALALLLALVVASALVPITRGQGRDVTPSLISAGTAPEKRRDDDLQVYDHVIARLRHGESYYPAVAAEHRAIGFPLTPGFAVRLPTLAYVEAAIGPAGEYIAAVLLLAAVLLAWWRRLGSEPGGAEHRLLAMALLTIGAVLVLNAYFFRLHELWAGMLLALSFGLHRPGKWLPAWLAAALALAIRELALPFVLLMAAMALWRRDWRGGAAWSALAALFLVGLALHLNAVAALVRPGDLVSASWLELRGLSGALSNLTLSSNLRYLPHWLAGPLVVLMVFGWASWRSPAGAFGALLFTGYAVAFAVAGRDENYYWGMLVTPCLAMGLAFLPQGARSLWRAAVAR